MPAPQFSCPVELAVTLLNGKWKVLVLARLKERPHHYGELRAAIPGLSDKVLTDRLRELVASGLVIQRKQGRRGAPATYSLSKRADALLPALDAQNRWGLAEAQHIGATFKAS